MIGVNFVSLFATFIQQLPVFGELIYNGCTLTGGSTVLWYDVAGQTDIFLLVVFVENTTNNVDYFCTLVTRSVRVQLLNLGRFSDGLASNGLGDIV